ncbi:MAG: hypothetical protein COV44_04230 [Deltaproteobacteria bacterium CG11_big_fil_rev_8_21_14_0_20_45_16]|nr:MAG: hypothetical protein COV44_04230 [Deltaproteobacteria bacterium CG11_big_fil_rev_8_21_14_0_20_45_16]
MNGQSFDLIWILFFLLFFVPFIQQRWLARTRKKFIREIEINRSSRVIVLVHRQEFLSMFGLPFFKYINIEDAEQILRAIRKTDPKTSIDLIIHTPGGLVLASTQIAMALKRHPGPVRVLIPHFAMSGGTLLALAADEILMSQNAVMGPVDPQVDQYPAASLLRAVKRKPLSEVDDKTLILADQAEKAIAQLEQTVVSLLDKKMDSSLALSLAQKLTSGTWTHDYPISFEEAKKLGFLVSQEIPDEVIDLMELYPQPTRRQSSVDYDHEDRKKEKFK